MKLPNLDWIDDIAEAVWAGILTAFLTGVLFLIYVLGSTLVMMIHTPQVIPGG